MELSRCFGNHLAGYRLYDDTALERLQCLMLFKELQFSLKDIKGILDSPDFERSRALEQQIMLLQMKKEHQENLIDLARGIKEIGVKRNKKSISDLWGSWPGLAGCRREILLELGQMYAGGGAMTENIDAFGGEGAAEYACRAIEIYCR